jgi:transposase
MYRPLQKPFERFGKKILETFVAVVITLHPGKRVRLWAEDEMRAGLHSTQRRVWAIKGQTPVAAFRREYKWLYVHAFVCPADGQTSWTLLPSMNKDLMALAGEEFVRDVDPKHEDIHILLMDGAGSHKGVHLPDNVITFPMLPYTPELQPAERLWPLLREPIANESFATLDQLEETLIERCRSMLSNPEDVQAITRFHWWPEGSVCI